MTGNPPDLPAFAALAREHDALLLAFVAVPTALKRFLKTMVPSCMYGRPVPVASLATTLLGLEVDRNRGDGLRALR